MLYLSRSLLPTGSPGSSPLRCTNVYSRRLSLLCFSHLHLVVRVQQFIYLATSVLATRRLDHSFPPHLVRTYVGKGARKLGV